MLQSTRSKSIAMIMMKLRDAFISSGRLFLLLVAMLSCNLASGSFIDIATPLDKRTTTSLVDGSTYHIVMSDEFNTPGRNFKDGHDPLWTALDKSDDDSSSAGGGSMQFYNSSSVTTTDDGFLKIATTLGKTEWNRYDHVKKEWKHETTYFKSGMVQTWEKFCFTGGIVEVDVIFPGDPYIGGLWPAIWMLGNLGRATYEASTNNIWPWSYNVCNRDLQAAQAISACNVQNHYGLNPHQGRGATEIDIVEVMTGDSNGPLPSTVPPIELPYGDMTLQVAPGVPSNRPQSGALPLRENRLSANGHTEFIAQTWYDGLELHGNTSINPFFYGTYLAETKPYEPVVRSKKQAFQADAVGVAHQLTPDHFKRPHTFRLEWQPGPGGRLDWFVKGYKVNETLSMQGDGKGTDWIRAFGLRDKSLKDLLGSQIPNEPSYLILNTAVSSTWGFPYDVPGWCQKCYDCDDPKCACAFAPGFCKMLKQGNVAMYIDSVRVYQSRNASAHVGNNHTLGCDPPEYPTREYILGHSYRYMRNPPFSYEDHDPLRVVPRGGGSCETDDDCGGNLHSINYTAMYLNGGTEEENDTNQRQRRSLIEDTTSNHTGHGQCVSAMDFGGILTGTTSTKGEKYTGKVCSCHVGYSGPHCMALDGFDDSPSAYLLKRKGSPFDRIPHFHITPFMLFVLVALGIQLVLFLIVAVGQKKNSIHDIPSSSNLRRPTFQATMDNDLIITGRSV